jgi:hypothetical protein
MILYHNIGIRRSGLVYGSRSKRNQKEKMIDSKMDRDRKQTLTLEKKGDGREGASYLGPSHPVIVVGRLHGRHAGRTRAVDQGDHATARSHLVLRRQGTVARLLDGDVLSPRQARMPGRSPTAVPPPFLPPGTLCGCWCFLAKADKFTGARKDRCSTSPGGKQGIVFS